MRFIYTVCHPTCAVPAGLICGVYCCCGSCANLVHKLCAAFHMEAECIRLQVEKYPLLLNVCEAKIRFASALDSVGPAFLGSASGSFRGASGSAIQPLQKVKECVLTVLCFVHRSTVEWVLNSSGALRLPTMTG